MQIAMVIDLNKCIGCQTCTMACKTQWTIGKGRDYMYWNNVETMPGKGYPKGYMEMNTGFDKNREVILGPLPSFDDYGKPYEFNHGGFIEGKNKVMGPEELPFWGPNWDEEVGEGDYPNNFYFYLPRLCNHCTDPACLAACSRKAIYKRKEDGIVLVDLERCRGYRDCVEACPYKKVYFNTHLKKVEKCIMCFPRLEKGIPSACARQCVGRARWQSYLEDKEGPVHKLVKVWKVALPLMPEKGTSPNVFYIPPFSPPAFDRDGRPTGRPRIPVSYLKKLFGDNVENVLNILKEEINKKAKGKPSGLMDILIAYRHKEMFKV